MLADVVASACLREAATIGVRIAGAAEWNAGRCTWTVVVPDPTLPGGRRPLWAPAGPAIYQGTAGIALFLTELFAATGDWDMRRTARGALEFALAELDAFRPASFGFHLGRVGVAYALARYTIATSDSWGADEARGILVPLFGLEAREAGLDVIGGAAGAIPVMLQLAENLALPAARESAITLGAGLVRSAHRWPEGWAWGPVGLGNARHLTGLAHGAAGFAAALLELWIATGEPEFRYAAEQGFAYEAHHHDPVLGNWRDYRSTEWSDAKRAPERLEALGAALRAGASPPRYRPKAMVAWCHGAPGIGLTRLRAHAVLGTERYATEARVAVDATQRALRAARPNYSLCHGVFGNCETILSAAEHLAQPGWRVEVEEWVREGIATHGGPAGRWPTGAIDALADPSLLIGEAGIGYFLLRLACPGVPSVLLPVAPGPPAASGDAGAVAEDDLRSADVQRYFGRTLRAFVRLGVVPYVGSDGAGRAPVLDAAAAIAAVVDAEPDPERASLLADAARVDRAFLASMDTFPDLGDEIAEELCRIPVEAVSWASARLSLAPCVRLVESERDWDTWLSHPADASAEPPSADGPTQYVLCRRQARMHVQRIGPFAAAVLATLAEWEGELGATARQVADRMLRDMGPMGVGGDEFRARVTEQIRRAYEGGLIGICHQHGEARQ